MTDLPFALMCPQCPHSVEVSEDDPDATLSEMYDHIFSRHANYQRARTDQLLARVREVPF